MPNLLDQMTQGVKWCDSPERPLHLHTLTPRRAVMLLFGSTWAHCSGMNRLIICVLFLALVGPVQAVLIADGNTGLVSAQAMTIVDGKTGLTSPDVVIDFGSEVLERFAPVSDQFPGVTFNDALYACCAEFAPAVDQGYLFGLNDTGIGPIVFDDNLSAVAFSWRTNLPVARRLKPGWMT